MNDFHKIILTILFLGLFILTCKKEENDYRTGLVGTYIVLCTEQQYHPYLGPGTSYPLDTTDIDKEIEVSFDPDNPLKNDTGIVNVNGINFNVRRDSTSIRYSALGPGHLESHTGRFILPDTLQYSWNSVNSTYGFYYRCRGVKL